MLNSLTLLSKSLKNVLFHYRNNDWSSKEYLFQKCDLSFTMNMYGTINKEKMAYPQSGETQTLTGTAGISVILSADKSPTYRGMAQFNGFKCMAKGRNRLITFRIL